MQKIVAFLAVVGYASAGNLLLTGAPGYTYNPVYDAAAVNYANIVHAAAGNSVISATAARQAAAESQAAAEAAASLRSQASAQSIINSANPSAVAVVAPASVPVAYDAATASARDTAALNAQIAQQDQINRDGNARAAADLAVQANLAATQNAGIQATQAVAAPVPGYYGYGLPAYAYGAVSARDAAALSNQIQTLNALNAYGALRHGAFTGTGLTYTPVTHSGAISARDAAALNAQIATQNSIIAGAAVRYGTVYSGPGFVKIH